MKAPFFLQSSSALHDTFFEDTIVFVAELNEEGATGFVINKVFPRQLNELIAFKHSKAFRLYEGGPVDTEHLFVLHRRPDLIRGSKRITDHLYIEGNMSDVIEAIDQDALTTSDLRLFIGYCGWNNGELEAEIAEGSWTIVNAQPLF